MDQAEHLNHKANEKKSRETQKECHHKVVKAFIFCLIVSNLADNSKANNI